MPAALLSLSLLVFSVPTEAIAQGAETAAHRRFVEEVEKKRRYEAEEREKQRRHETEEAEKDRALLLKLGGPNPGTVGVNNRSSTDYRATYSAFEIPAGLDPLQGWDVPTYRQGNGVVLRVSGELRPDAPTICIANCP